MIEIKNLRIEDMDNGWSRAIADISFTDMQSPYEEKHIWFAARCENRAMLSDDSYDAFLLVPLYLAMYHKQELHIRGCVSKRLYKNIMTYVQTILCDFSDELSKVDVFADGYTENTFAVGGAECIIGTGISCGVDSLSTIYDHFINEDDPEYKINALFFFNCGTHGDYENPKTFELYENRYNLNKRAAGEMGLPFYQVDSNLHAFTFKICHVSNGQAGYLAIWSCILAFENAIKKYYVSSANEYEEIKTFSKYVKNNDMAEFCESYLVPLICTENLEMIIDGCQYKRSEKTERISNWEIAQKYLNVCGSYPDDGKNCSKCQKCMRTQITLDAMNKLDAFSDVFDLKIYKKYLYFYMCYFKAYRKEVAFANDIVGFCGVHGYPLPPALITKPFGLLHKFYRFCCRRCPRRIKDKLKKLMGKTR